MTNSVLPVVHSSCFTLFTGTPTTAYFGADGMVGVLTSTEALYHKVRTAEPDAQDAPEIQATAREIDRSLSPQLEDALHRVAAHIRNHPEDYLQLV